MTKPRYDISTYLHRKCYCESWPLIHSRNKRKRKQGNVYAHQVCVSV